MFTKLLSIFSFFLFLPHSAAPQKDGIPAVDRPSFVSVEEAGSWIGETEPVIVLRREERKKIYPLQILMYHEIVNDKLAVIPVAVTYCPLCNTGTAFRRTVIPSTVFWRFPKGRRQTITVTGRCGSSGRPIAVFWFPAYAFSEGDFPGEKFIGGEEPEQN